MCTMHKSEAYELKTWNLKHNLLSHNFRPMERYTTLLDNMCELVSLKAKVERNL